MPMSDMPRLEFVTRVEADIAPAYVIGDVGTGVREVIPILGGRFDGPLLRGEVLPGGADWCLVRADGSCDIWARYTLRTHDGVLISVINAGRAAANADGNFEGRTVPQFEVAEGPYGWLRDAAFVGTLLTDAAGTRARLDFYRIA
jgi:hypothetical protein